MSLFEAAAAQLNNKVSNSTTPKLDTAASLLSGAQDIFTKFFEPAVGKVRVRDFIRETPASTAKVLTRTANLAKDILQGTARVGGSVGVTASNLLTGSQIREIKPPDEIKNFEDSFYSVLFGNDALESIGTRIEKAPSRAKEFGFGLDKIVTPQSAPVFIPLLTALDFTGAGKGVSKIPEALKGLAAEARKFKSADEFVKAINKTGVELPIEVDKLSDFYNMAVKNPPPINPIKFGDSEFTTGRERGFITTMKESPGTSPEVKAKIASNYNPITNKQTLDTAKNLITTNKDEAYRLARALDEAPTAESNAVAQLLIQDAQNAGRWNEAIDLVNTTAERATKQGQAIQALSIWNRLTPEGILRHTQSVVNKINKELPANKQIKISDELAKDVVTRARKIEKMADGEDKAVATAEMLAKINELYPVTIGKKIATVQTLVQLLNPKTLIRNIGGNTGFSAIENVKDVFAAGLDSPLSLITGKRSTALPSINVQAKGFKEGLRIGVRDALLGVDTMGVPSQFDIPNTPVFKGVVGKSAEKLLNVALRAPDRAMYKAAYDGSIYKQMIADSKTTGKMLEEPTEAMKEVAHLEGLYRTFQDYNTVSTALTGLKKVLNLGKDFGLGDIILKYPKTPGSLIARGIDYSPAGFFNSMFQVVRPLAGKEFNQKEFVESFSRAFVGTSGLVGSGALMHRLGIITGKREKDKDISAVQQATGLGQYKINASALKRFVYSGFDPEAAKLQKGDKLYTYDWFQPLAIGISMGANLDETHQNNERTGEKALGIAGTLIEGVASGADTIGEQPLLKNITRVLEFGGGISEALLTVIKQIPASFMPTFLNQVNQFVDNRSKNTYDPNIIHEAFNLAKKRVPGLSDDLQPNVDVFGKPKETYQNGSNNLFNVFFNPAFKTVYQPTPEAQLVLDLFNETGEVKQSPRVQGKTVSVNGKNMKIGPKQMVAMQQFTGTITRWYFNQLAQNDDFKKLSNEDKIKHMSNVLSDVGSAAKIVVLGDRPKKNPGYRVQIIIANYMKNQFLSTEPLINQ